VIDHDNAVKSILHVTNFKTVEPTASVEPTAAVEPVISFSPNSPSSHLFSNQNGTEAFLFLFKVCPICLTNPKDMAFGCGHMVSSSKLSFHVGLIS
jgi:E3 ubiquitin-protein ligase RGLG